MRAREFVLEGVDFTNAVNSIEQLVRSNNIKFNSYEDLVKFVASRNFLQNQRNDQQFINDVSRSVLRRLHQVAESQLLDHPTKTPEQLAKKHGVSVKDIESQLKKGIKVEREHTSHTDVAREIALDHLDELPDYYSKLKKAEK